MKVFCDFHHGALARAMGYLFADRLGLEFYLPGADCSVNAGASQDGTWGCPDKGSLPKIGFSLEETEKINIATFDDFQNIPWDIILLTRVESAQVLKRHGHPKPGIMYVGVSGNEGTSYPWAWVHHLIATDLHSYRICPPTVKKIHIPQELGRYFDKGVVPIAPENLNHIGSFTNNLKGYNLFIQVACRPKPVHLWQMWEGMKAGLPTHRFTPYGHGNVPIGGESIMDSELAAYYHACSLNWNFKTYEGYGHSLLQGMPAGRLALCPSGFYDSRTAGKYLIDGETCLFADYTAQSCTEKIKWFTSDLNRANDMSAKCYEAYKRLFDFEADAERVKEWLEI